MYRAKAIDPPHRSATLSPAQRDWLQKLSRGLDPWRFVHGRSEHGGANGTVASLSRRGFIDGMGCITAAGKAALSGN